MPTTGRSLLDVVARKLRRLTSAFREKPTVSLDEYLLEHLMFYHGLVGSSPENQPRFKDVRADIFDALSAGSSVQMCIALKLPPLWWEERLVQIFDEAMAHHAANMAPCLLPAGEVFELSEEHDPLRHPDWRVRSNAARILGHLKNTDAVPRMAESLKSSAVDQKAAFCHLAYALACLQTTGSRRALEAYLQDDEPWFRVDCAGGLSHWPLPDVADVLMSAMLAPHALSDYMAVAIVKRHSAEQLLQMESVNLQEGALETVIRLLQAGQGTFTQDVLMDANLFKCLPRVVELARTKKTPRRVKAALSLAQWVEGNSVDIAKKYPGTSVGTIEEEVSAIRNEFSKQNIADSLIGWLKEFAADSGEVAQLRHAAWLAGDFKLTEAAPYLVPRAVLECPARDDVIDALGAIGSPDSARALLALVPQLVDTQTRASGELNAHAVFEDNPRSAKTYWHVLRALGKLGAPDAVECLLAAFEDVAADKRAEALSSLIALCETPKIKQENVEVITARIARGLDDPAASVKAVAVTGIGQLGMGSMIPDLVKLACAPDTHVWRAATAALKRLYASGDPDEVKLALKEAASRERNKFRRQKLFALLDSLAD